jgi:hypothetical protein
MRILPFSYISDSRIQDDREGQALDARVSKGKQLEMFYISQYAAGVG